MSARRHLSASLIPGRLCVLVLTANIETSEQSPELPQGESRDVQVEGMAHYATFDGRSRDVTGNYT